MTPLDTYRDHGEAPTRIEQVVKEIRWVLERLAQPGTSIDNVTRRMRA